MSAKEEVAMDVDQLKQYFDAQLHDVKVELHGVKTQLTDFEKNFSQKFSDLTVYCQNILCIVNNLDKAFASNGSSKANCGDQCGRSNGKTEDTETESDSAIDENFTILSLDGSSEEKTTQISKKEASTSDQSQKSLEKTGSSVESEREKVITGTEEKTIPWAAVERFLTKLQITMLSDQSYDEWEEAVAKNRALQKDSGLHKTQSSTVDTQQLVLDDKASKQSAKAVIDYYVTHREIAITENTLYTAFPTNENLIKFVDFFIEDFVKASEARQKLIGPLLGKIVDSKHNILTPQIIAQRFYYFPLSMGIYPGNILTKNNQIIKDTEKTLELWDHMALLIGYMLSSDQFNFDHVWHSCKSILYTETGERVLSLIFKVIYRLKGAIWICSKWENSRIDSMKDFTKRGSVKVLPPNLKYHVIDGKLVFTVMDEIKTPILQTLRFQADNSMHLIQKWLKEQWGPNPHNEKIIVAVVSAICTISVVGGGRSAPGEERFNPDPWKKHTDLIKFLVNKDVHLEALCLRAICKSLQSDDKLSAVLILNIFSHLLMYDTISLEGFKEFRAKEMISTYGLNIFAETPFFWESIVHGYDIKESF